MHKFLYKVVINKNNSICNLFAKDFNELDESGFVEINCPVNELDKEVEIESIFIPYHSIIRIEKIRPKKNIKDNIIKFPIMYRGK